MNDKIQITFEFSPHSGSDFTVGVFLLLIGGDSRSVLIDLLEIKLGELLWRFFVDSWGMVHIPSASAKLAPKKKKKKSEI